MWFLVPGSWFLFLELRVALSKDLLKQIPLYSAFSPLDTTISPCRLSFLSCYSEACEAPCWNQAETMSRFEI
ncbi:hypothetical protein F5Y12DRAFT_758607 [Xylaria sp. FL1777]|nr:hypothetical protein F5Y12DRAFT_758607 [Xylaria sp. FL1777]